MATKLDIARSTLKKREEAYRAYEAASELILTEHRKEGRVASYRPGLWGDAYDFDARQDRVALDRIGDKLRSLISAARRDVRAAEIASRKTLDTPLIK